MRMTEKLLTAFLMRNSIRISSPLLEHFWETSTRRALAMAHIARQLYGVDHDLAYTCGLFCHVGIPILMQVCAAMPHADRGAGATGPQLYRDPKMPPTKPTTPWWGHWSREPGACPPRFTRPCALHHDFTILQDQQALPAVRTLVAMALVAEQLVAWHEGAEPQREWARHSADCLAYLAVQEREVDSWLDVLHPAFEGVALA
jgi:hypothetical protein